MVDVSTTTLEDAADSLDRLLEGYCNDRELTPREIYEAVEATDLLREILSVSGLPETGTYVRDTEHGSSGPPLEVVEVHPRSEAQTFECTGDKTVWEQNRMYPPDDRVVGVALPGSDKVYHYPVSRLEW